MDDTRIIPCQACGGDKGHDVPYDIDRRDGSTIDRWQPCVACDATGDQEIELRPITLEDLQNCPCGGWDCSASPGGPLYNCPYVLVGGVAP